MDYYAILEINHNASFEEIKNAFRRLVLQYHPDKNKQRDAPEKFRAIVEAYEMLCQEKGQKDSDYAELLIRPGKVKMGNVNEYSQVEITQGDAFLYGTLVTSKAVKYSVIFCDGYGYTDTKEWRKGKVCLIEKDEIIWVKEYERPWNAAVSDEGRVALVHTFNRDTSSLTSAPKEFIDLGSKLSVIEVSGEEKWNHDFGSNAEACTISSDGNLISVATLMPDYSVYCFDCGQRILLWKYKNPSNISGISDLEFNGDKLEVFSQWNGTKEKEYELKLDGTLTQEYNDKLDAFMKIKKLVPKERVKPVLGMIRSSNTREVVQGLAELKSLVTTKGSLSEYARIADTLRSVINDDNLFYSVWEVIRKMLKKQPSVIDPLVPNIISWFKHKHETPHITAFLLALGELGKVNPSWIKKDWDFVKASLKSKQWNERRYAIIAIGLVGSVEPSLVKDVIPELMEYVADPEKVAKELDYLAGVEPSTSNFHSPFANVTIKFTIKSNTDTIAPTWLRDASIDAIGKIGMQFPDLVAEAIPLLERISKDALEPYTIKKAIKALESIRGSVSIKDARQI
jgi:DnaJ domain